MYKRICIIGLGSIGGFLSNNLSKSDSLESLVLIDYDKVEINNLRNSIYEESDIGNYKTKCMYDKIHNLNKELEIICMNKRYVEGKTKIPKCDLVIDCRDFVCNRNKEIDIKLSISSKYLIIDCRKNIKHELHYGGKYTISLEKNEIMYAVSTVSGLIINGLIKEFTKEKIIHAINIYQLKRLIEEKYNINDINYLKKITEEALETYNYEDIIFESYPGDEKLSNLVENSESIINLNKQYDLNICLDDKNDYLNRKTIPKLAIQDINDLTKNILSIVNLPKLRYNNYVIQQPIVENNICYIILIPERGAA